MTSNEFAQLRKELGLTQAELAAIMGSTQPSIARIESGERQPTKILAAFIRYIAAHAADLSVDQLQGGRGENIRTH